MLAGSLMQHLVDHARRRFMTLDAHAVTPPGTSFDECYERERLALTRLAFLLVGSLPAAEDIVGDAFAAALPRWAHLDQPGAYLRRSVVNGALTRLRKGSSERSFLNRQRPEEPTTALGSDELWDAIGRLPIKQRSAVVLTYYLDLDSNEAARILGCRPGTVRSLTSRALEALRKEVAP